MQPIAERKDGIQAMFAKQAKPSQNSTASQPSTSTEGKKRQRTQSPPLKKEVKTGPSEVSGEPLNKKLKVERLNTTWEDDSDIEYLDAPPQSQVSHSATSIEWFPNLLSSDVDVKG